MRNFGEAHWEEMLLVYDGNIPSGDNLYGTALEIRNRDSVIIYS